MTRFARLAAEETAAGMIAALCVVVVERTGVLVTCVLSWLVPGGGCFRALQFWLVSADAAAG